jgi:hypothetical protein
VPLHAASFDTWWTRTSALAGPLAGMLAAMPEPARAMIRERLRDVVAPFATPDGLTLPGVTMIATTRRPTAGCPRGPAVRTSRSPGCPASAPSRSSTTKHEFDTASGRRIGVLGPAARVVEPVHGAVLRRLRPAPS